MNEVVTVILAGGRGSRISHLLKGIPKPLAPVCGAPFLEWVLRFYANQGLNNFYISSGYMADEIDRFVNKIQSRRYTLTTVRETQPLGTGGAFLNVVRTTNTKPKAWLICNGDSIAIAKLDVLLDQTRLLDDFDGAMLGIRVPDASRYGSLSINNRGVLEGFLEKKPGKGIINAGVYLLNNKLIDKFPSKVPLSFEYDVFPHLLSIGARIKVMALEAPFLDIGTEGSLKESEMFIQSHLEWFQ